MYCYLQHCLWLKRLAAGVFWCKQHTIFQTSQLKKEHICSIILTVCAYFRKHPIDTECKSIQSGGWIFILSSRIDPCLVYLVLYLHTVPKSKMLKSCGIDEQELCIKFHQWEGIPRQLFGGRC